MQTEFKNFNNLNNQNPTYGEGGFKMETLKGRTSLENISYLNEYNSNKHLQLKNHLAYIIKQVANPDDQYSSQSSGVIGLGVPTYKEAWKDLSLLSKWKEEGIISS